MIDISDGAHFRRVGHRSTTGAPPRRAGLRVRGLRRRACHGVVDRRLAVGHVAPPPSIPTARNVPASTTPSTAPTGGMPFATRRSRRPGMTPTMPAPRSSPAIPSRSGHRTPDAARSVRIGDPGLEPLYLAALVVLYGLTAREYDVPTARRATVLLALFPASFFFLVPYSESLFLLLTVLTFWWFRASGERSGQPRRSAHRSSERRRAPRAGPSHRGVDGARSATAPRVRRRLVRSSDPWRTASTGSDERATRCSRCERNRAGRGRFSGPPSRRGMRSASVRRGSQTPEDLLDGRSLLTAIVLVSLAAGWRLCPGPTWCTRSRRSW